MANIHLNIKTINGQSIVGTGDINTDQDLSSYAPISYVDQSIQALFIPTSTDDLINNSGYITINDIPSIPTKLSQFINDEGFIKLNEVPQTKVDGITIEYNQNDELVVIGGGGGGSGDINVQSDWNESDNTKDEYIKNKPVNVSDFNVDIDLSELTDNTNKLFSGDYDDLNNKPTLFDGDYDSLSNKPNIPQDLSDLTDSTNLLHDTTYSAGSHINIDGSNEISVDKSSLNIPSDLSDLSDSTNLLFSGDYDDLSNKPTIPTNNNQLTNGAGYVTTDTTYSADDGINIDGSNKIKVKVDGTTIDFNGSGELEAIGGGSGGTPKLSEVLDEDNETGGNDIIINNSDVITLKSNTSGKDAFVGFMDADYQPMFIKYQNNYLLGTGINGYGVALYSNWTGTGLPYTNNTIQVTSDRILLGKDNGRMFGSTINNGYDGFWVGKGYVGSYDTQMFHVGWQKNRHFFLGRDNNGDFIINFQPTDGFLEVKNLRINNIANETPTKVLGINGDDEVIGFELPNPDILDLKQENDAYTLQLSDVGKTLLVGGNITIPTNASVPFEIGTKIEGVAMETLDIVADTGVTILSKDDNVTVPKYTAFTLMYLGSDEWMLIGGLE